MPNMLKKSIFSKTSSILASSNVGLFKHEIANCRHTKSHNAPQITPAATSNILASRGEIWPLSEINGYS